MPNTATRVALGGTAVVCCVHDRVKREVTDPEHVAYLGQAVGQVYDPRQHKLVTCACCENLFVEQTDTPMFCPVCRGALVHPLGGPLPTPNGATR